jgi:Helix-turn-helix domain (DUF4817)
MRGFFTSLLIFLAFVSIGYGSRRFKSAKSFAARDKAPLVCLFERADRSYAEFSKLARRKFGLRDNQLPDRKTLEHWCNTFMETGCVERTYHARTP